MKWYSIICFALANICLWSLLQINIRVIDDSGNWIISLIGGTGAITTFWLVYPMIINYWEDKERQDKKDEALE